MKPRVQPKKNCLILPNTLHQRMSLYKPLSSLHKRSYTSKLVCETSLFKRFPITLLLTLQLFLRLKWQILVILPYFVSLTSELGGWVMQQELKCNPARFRLIFMTKRGRKYQQTTPLQGKTAQSLRWSSKSQSSRIPVCLFHCILMIKCINKQAIRLRSS